MMTSYLRSRLPSFAPIRPTMPQPNRWRRPHPAATVEAVRQLVTTTRLPLREIAARTGTSPSTISRRARRHGWLRPETGFPEEHVTPEGRRRLKRSALAEALLVQAERIVFETEMNPSARPRQILQAARLIRLSRKLDQEEGGARSRRKGPAAHADARKPPG